jgi:hypothetical protein
MAYRFEICKCPVEMIEPGLIIAYIARAEKIGMMHMIECANERGLRAVLNHLAFRSDILRNGDIVSETKGWRYFVRWIDKPRAKKFHNLYRNKFLGNSGAV